MNLQNHSTMQLLEFSDVARKELVAQSWQELIDYSDTVKPVYVIDTETTGVGKHDSVIEVALVRLHDGEVVYQKYFLPFVKINPHAEKVHKLSVQRLKELGATMWQPSDYETLQVILADSYVLEWSTGFDLRLMNQTGYHIFSTGDPIGGMWRNVMRDYDIARGKLTKNGKNFAMTKLQYACEELHVPFNVDEAHGAAYDAQKVVHVMHKLCQYTRD